MDKFVDKFNIYDLFSMLIPGIGITTLLGITLSFRYYELWKNYGSSKYVVFFILSYFCGVIFHELGAIVNRLLFKIIYGGKPREICFMDPKPKKRWQLFRVIIFDNDEFFGNVKTLYEYICNQYVYISNDNSSKNGEKRCNRNDKNLNSIVFGYCVNIAENKNIIGKYKNFNVISEMSLSLFIGCFITIIINGIMFIVDPCHYVYYIIIALILIVLAYIFIHRKVRYER
ncbi:MAG: hypothetical protein J1E83_13650, partial [Lachnospiraceae bacterium]|nr:hypothetical protein [Lachnospiraceae bacterium]